MPAILRDAALAIQIKRQAPLAICAQSVLAAASLCTQAFANVCLPTGEEKPLSLFFLTIAESGERKSGCDDLALKPIRIRENELLKQHTLIYPLYENEQAAWEKQRAQILNNKKNKTKEDKQRELDDLGPGPSLPLTPLLTCPEPTYEGLCKLLEHGQASIGIFSDEGGQFIAGYGMSDTNKIRTAAGLSKAWDGGAIKRVRATDGVSILPGRRVSFHLMAQPQVASTLLDDQILIDQGLLSRLLVSYPASTISQRKWQETNSKVEQALHLYTELLLSMLHHPLPLSEGKQNELQPKCLVLSPEAKAIWIACYEHIETEQADIGKMANVRGFANKLVEMAARIAGVFTLIESLDATVIQESQMEAAIAVMEYYADEASRLFSSGFTHPKLQQAEKLRVWLLEQWKEPFIGLPEIYQFGPLQVRDKHTAKKLVDVLIEHHWLFPLEGGAIVRGQHRREAYRINHG